ncbi:glycogen-binding domain-containing protein [Deferribacter abyssi]|uniref:glycogen-binding domain-containing protein n=1 Tax=Deferribacter abyssi TaxID=213806 RepID=UPI003C1837BB
MREFLISKYIDDELTLKEKEIFIKEVMRDTTFGEEVLGFIGQEYLLRDNIEPEREVNFKQKRKVSFRFVPAIMSAVASILIVFAVLNFQNSSNSIALKPNEMVKEYRFVIYKPDAKKVEITGTFSNWQRIKMKRIDDTGYFEVSLKLKPGEYKYSFVIDDKYTTPDPTIIAREKDDFGNVNSILELKEEV